MPKYNPAKEARRDAKSLGGRLGSLTKAQRSLSLMDNYITKLGTQLTQIYKKIGNGELKKGALKTAKRILNQISYLHDKLEVDAGEIGKGLVGKLKETYASGAEAHQSSIESSELRKGLKKRYSLKAATLALPLLLISLSLSTLMTATNTMAAIGITTGQVSAIKISAFIILIIAMVLLYLHYER